MKDYVDVKIDIITFYTMIFTFIFLNCSKFIITA